MSDLNPIPLWEAARVLFFVLIILMGGFGVIASIYKDLPHCDRYGTYETGK